MLYDFYRTSAQLLKFKRRGFILGDTIFWLLLTPTVFILLLWGNWGEMRLYVLAGLILGAILYLKVFSSLTLPLIKALFKIIGGCINVLISILAGVWKIICLPFQGVYLAIIFPVKLLRGLKNHIKQWIKPNKKT